MTIDHYAGVIEPLDVAGSDSDGNIAVVCVHYSDALERGQPIWLAIFRDSEPEAIGAYLTPEQAGQLGHCLVSLARAEEVEPVSVATDDGNGDKVIVRAQSNRAPDEQDPDEFSPPEVLLAIFRDEWDDAIGAELTYEAAGRLGRRLVQQAALPSEQ